MISVKTHAYKYLLPNLLEIQRISFCWFLEKGLIHELENLTTLNAELYVRVFQSSVIRDVTLGEVTLPLRDDTNPR